MLSCVFIYGEIYYNKLYDITKWAHSHTLTHIKIYGVITVLPCYNMCKAMMKSVRISYDIHSSSDTIL